MKKITNTATKDIKELTPEEAGQIASIALEEYKQTAQGAIFEGKSFDDLGEMYQREFSASPSSAKALFTPFIGILLEKVLMSTLAELPSLEYMSFIDMFRGEDITIGASIEHQAQQIGGYLPYDRSKWIPDAAQYKTVLSQVVSLDSPDFQKVKIPLTINVNEIQYYLLSKPKLSAFLNQQREALSKTHTLIMFNAVMDKITKTTFAKTITGTATNMFDAIIEVTGAITEMGQLSNEFNLIDQVTIGTNGQATTAKEKNLVTNSSFGDLLWIWSLSNENKATMGVKSQLFNRDLWGDPVTSKMNMVSLKSRYDVSNTNPAAAPTKNATDWIDNNTIYVINKNAFKVNYQLDNVVTSQYYAENMLLQINVNAWFLCSAINFGQALKYTNTNLSTLPN